jgi:thioredoxin reductase (NADPH)
MFCFFNLILSLSLRRMSKFDFAVIGGGSGGLAAAKEASRLGAKVVLFDFVSATPLGTKWGFAGTCVNVGCIPKKLFHYAGLCGEAMWDAEHLGWKVPSHPQHDWDTLRDTVNNYIRKLNFSYRTGVKSAGVEYINAKARLHPTDSSKVIYEVKGEEKEIEAKYVLLATGGRPTYPSHLPNAKDLCITSDDLFTLKKAPGKTLVLGGGYIAMECAGFLVALGYDVTVSVRSKPLRAFDSDCSRKIVEVMTELGLKFRNGVEIKKLERSSSSQLIRVEFSDGHVEEFETVLLAIGRTPETKSLNLPESSTNNEGKVIVDSQCRVKNNLFAVGDLIINRPELTPVAIKDGELLARRLFANKTETLDRPELIPTTVFTPIEYGSIGFSEEKAIEIYGKDNIECYLYEWQTLEKSAVHRPKLEHLRIEEADDEQGSHNFTKIIVRKDKNEEILGFHFIGPNAGEVTQGFALAMRLGATKSDLDQTMGIHPTDAEALVSLTITKSSGEDYKAAGGCGGGKCG